ncbi:MAG: hypothetical protein AAF447_17325 [Myxococcota bacterium]
MKVLLIHHDAAVLRPIEWAARSRGHDVRSVDTVRQAADAAELGHADAVIVALPLAEGSIAALRAAVGEASPIAAVCLEPSRVDPLDARHLLLAVSYERGSAGLHRLLDTLDHWSTLSVRARARLLQARADGDTLLD